MQQLSVDPAMTMAQMARYSVSQVEGKFEAWQRVNDQLDSLRRSEVFFVSEYVGDDKDDHLAEIRKMIGQAELLLVNTTPPRSIGQLNRENEIDTNKAIALMVNDLRKYFILDRMITGDGILSLVPMIIVTYPSLTMEELAVCFCNAKKGLYGEDFQRMDGSTIMKWIRLFMEDKVARLANKQYTKEVQYKAGKDVGRTERGESIEVMLKKATGAVLVMKAINEKK